MPALCLSPVFSSFGCVRLMSYLHCVEVFVKVRVNGSAWLLLIYFVPGRSLNSCQFAFHTMCQEQQQQQQQQQLQQPQMSVPVNPGLVPFPPPRHELSAPTAVRPEASHMRKRPLFLLDKQPLAPRAIQPRPAASTASYSSESSASALLSPSLESTTTKGEPPRKRGRPSKAEAERRKAAAEARGEAYPPPRSQPARRYVFRNFVYTSGGSPAPGSPKSGATLCTPSWEASHTHGTYRRWTSKRGTDS
ncbi:AT DNA binding protein, putative [Aspergillus fumigatus A1163]|uniref:AT DNA binding protein, putative n=1 Tax=Aspergillus fumigatus (strain CBS 144.89 / FGSC A1163 / CEA10) TaxID=451804 RepID=B0Y3A8_ASPFC|nr:AT DNA binding protein, putative [Aspergillus fumigatus A1163]